MRNLPDQSTEKQVEQFFRPHLASLNINTFYCHRLKGRGLATITIADVTKAQKFLSLHGQTAPGPEAFARVQKKLYHMKRPINCCQSRNNPDPYLLRSLEKDEKDKQTDPSRKAKLAPSRPRDLQRRYDIRGIACGQWDYMDGRLVFISQFQEQRGGIMVFGKQSLRIDLHPAYITMPGHRLEISYGSVESFTTGSAPNPTVTFSLAEPPKILEDLDTLSAKMSNLALKKQETAMIRKRSQAVNKAHEKVVSSCMCYRVALSKPSDISRIQALKRLTEIPQSIFWDTYSVLRNDFPDQLTLLNNALSGGMFDHISFEVKFQFQRLAQNGYLPAARVVELLILVAQNIDGVDDSTLITAVRKLSHQIPYPGPSTDSTELDAMALIKLLKEHVQSIEREGNYSAGIVEEYDHLALIHKATVTPTGIILSGPEPEIKNRVLRKYSSFSNYFLQVSFLDEDMEPLRYNRYVSNDDVYQKRFKKVLDGIIFIAGRGYEVCD